jgi:hypothetical protein
MVNSSLVMDTFFFLFSSFFFLSMDAFPFQFFASLDFDVVSQTALGPVVFGQDCYWQE